MDPIVGSLISAVAGLLGALIGAFTAYKTSHRVQKTALEASLRAQRTAFVQVHYSRKQDLRYEALANVYGLLHVLNDQFVRWAAHDREELAPKVSKVSEAESEARLAMLKAWLWISPGVSTEISQVIDAFGRKRIQLLDAATNDLISQEEYNEIWHGIDEWASAPVTIMVQNVQRTIEDALKREEEEQLALLTEEAS